MKGLSFFAVLLLLLSWRRLSSVSAHSVHAHRHHDDLDEDVSAWLAGIAEEDPGLPHVNALRHKIMFPRLAMRERLRNAARGGQLKSQLIRHTARLMDRFLNEGDNFTLLTFPGGRAHNHSGLENLTISQLIENLRGLNGRRRRSSMANLKMGPETAKKMSKDQKDKKVAEIDGQIVLGGLMMVHERGDTVTCGPIMPQGGIQALETMLYTVDKINAENKILPNISLGVHILDDCDKDTYGLEQAVEFIKGSISNIDDVDVVSEKCTNGSMPGTMKNKVISGVVGAASSVTSIQVANLLRLFKIPQVSFFSTSPELSNKQRYEYFARTIPSDKNQVQVMFDIIDRFGWKYISIIYEESNYGTKALEEFEKLLPKRNICIAAKEMLLKDSGVAEDQTYDLIVKGIQAAPRAKGVIVFGSDQEVKALMRAVRRRNATGSFTWIGSDGWSSRTLVSDGNEREVEGTLSVQPRAKPVIGFDEYFFNLSPKNNTRNPWFIEFWEHHFQCKYPNSTEFFYNQHFYNRTCTGDEKLTRNNTQFEAQLQFVSDAVLAFAHALGDMHKNTCGNMQGICEQMKPVDGTSLMGYLKNVKFMGLSNDDFHFDAFSDGPARYNIIHFRWMEETNKYAWVRVGEYNEGNLTLDMTKIRFADGTANPPVSVCSDPCGPGESKGRVQGSSGSCCWTCIKCVGDQIRHETNESSCKTCAMGTLPNKNIHTKCIPIPEEYLKPTSGWAIGAMAFAGVGILLTVFVFTVFISHNDTPVVRASGREVSYVLLSGLLLCYALTFLFVIRPNDIICGVQQFCTGFCFTIVYAALLTKTNRIARIFLAGKKSARRPSFISPRSQLVICSMLLSIQVIINVVWMLLQPPTAIPHYPTRSDNLLVCNTYINASYAIAFAYPIILIVVCTVYAVLTRKIPEAFNESKYIGFTMYTTCIIWLAFVPIYFSTANQVALRITSMTVAISLSATVMVACLFAPKLYIILIHPERNVRQSMMPATKYSALASNAVGGGAGGPNASGALAPGTMAPIPMTVIATGSNHVGNAHAAKPKMDRGTQSDGVPGVDYKVTMEERVRQLNAYNELLHKSNCSTQTDNNNLCSPLSPSSSRDGVSSELSSNIDTPPPVANPPRIVTFLKQNHGGCDYEEYEQAPSAPIAIIDKDGRLVHSNSDSDVML